MSRPRASPTIDRAASRSGKGFRVRFGVLSVRMARRRACKPLLGVCGSFPGQINGGLIACVPGGWILTGNSLGINDSCWEVGWNEGGGPPRLRKSSICHGSRTGQGLSGLGSEKREAETESGYSWGSERVYVRDRITCSTERVLGRKVPAESRLSWGFLSAMNRARAIREKGLRDRKSGRLESRAPSNA